MEEKVFFHGILSVGVANLLFIKTHKNKNMKVAFDISPLKKGHRIRGVGNYTRNLVFWLEKLTRRSDKILIDFVDFSKKNVKLSSYDLIHYPYTDLFFVSLPLFKPAKVVTTIHDVTPLLFPRYYPLGLKGRLRFLIQRFLISKVNAVITDSFASKRDIVKYLGYPKNQIFPIYLGVESHFRKIKNREFLDKIRQKYKLPSKFVLYVGDVNYNKNLIRLADACKNINMNLVIVGKQAVMEEFDRKHPENQMWVNFLEKYDKDPQILRIGFLPAVDLVAVYNLASVYCQPSLYEGFGLPILEAMACGCPVVASKIPAFLEIAKSAVLFMNPLDREDISRKLLLALEDLSVRKRLIVGGFLNVKRFSWGKCAREILSLYTYVYNKET